MAQMGLSKICAAAAILALSGVASADVFSMPAGQVSLNLVTVGDPGNAADPLTGFGSVPYTYQMGEFDVTVAQYTQFLNSVAATDPYGLYSPNMFPGAFGSCGIIQSGTAGSFTYSFPEGNANLPVNNVSWGDAARFCNWLANGQPDIGVEDAATTEDGSYAINGAVFDAQLKLIKRSPFATYVIPTENEWYKAAYFKGGSSTNAGYWLYPTQSDDAPSNVISLTGTDNANFVDPVLGFTNPDNGLTPAGSFPNSTSAFGTLDQGGDVYQWIEASNNELVLGGAYSDVVDALESNASLAVTPPTRADVVGFRIVDLPDPNALILAILGGVFCHTSARHVRQQRLTVARVLDSAGDLTAPPRRPDARKVRCVWPYCHIVLTRQSLNGPQRDGEPNSNV